MKTRVLKWLVTGAFFYILFVFRVHDYGRYPLAGHADELNYGWSGISLIRDGKPFGWSYHKAYPDSWVFYDGVIDPLDQIKVGGRMVRPWLDQPPLFSLLAGGSAHLFGDSTWSVLPISHIRIPSVIFGFLSTLIIFFWMKKWFGLPTGILAATAYTLTPLILFGSRYALPENGVSFLYLSGLYLFSLYLDKPRPMWLFLVTLCAGLAGWMKPTGFMLAPLVSLLLLSRKKYLPSFAVIAGIIPFVLAYLVYGYYLGGSQFWEILRVQGFRPTGWSALGFLFTTPSFSVGTFFDGWYIFLFASSLAITLYRKHDSKIRYLSLGFFFWILVIILSAGEQDLLAWYRYPLSPFISMLGSIALIDFISAPQLFSGIFVIGTLLSSRFYLSNAFMPTTSTYVFKILFTLLISPFFFDSLKKIQKWVLVGVVVVGLFLNARYIYSAFSIRCDSISCPIQKETRLSHLRLPVLWRWLVPHRYIGVW